MNRTVGAIYLETVTRNFRGLKSYAERAIEQLDAEGGSVVAVWHSHVEVGAYFSAKDRADAVVDGVQQVPGAEYLVFGVRSGRVTEVKRYRWDGREFVEIEPRP